MAEVFRIFSDKIEAKMASIFERAIKDENDSLAAAIKRLQHNIIETERFGSNKSFYIGEGFARGRHNDTLDRMRKFYEREEKIESSFARHFSMMSDRRGLRNANTSATRDETWMYQLGLKKSDVSSNFSYLADQEKDQRDFDSKLKAAQTKGIIEAQKKRQAGFDRGHSAEVRARLGQMHDAKAFRYAMMDTDERKIRTLMDSHRSWNRGQAEQVYFHQLTENTKWLRLIGKNNPKIAKNLIPIAKAVGKASGLPIIGAFARNPALGAITALIGGGLSAGSYSLGRSRTLAKWMNARAVTGDIGFGTFHGLAAAGMSYEQMLQSLSKYSIKASEARFGGGFDKYAELAKYGVDVSGLFNPYLTAEERRAEEYRVISSANRVDRAAMMSIIGMSPEEYRSERLKNTPRSEWSLSDLQLDIYQGVTKKMKENHPILDFFIPDKFYQFHSLLAANKEIEDRKFFGDKAVDARNEIYNLHRWDEIRETAEIDDRYRAGMFDNSVTNNETNNGKSLTVINNWGGVSVETNDPVRLAEGLEAGIGNKFIGSREVAEWFDTKAVK